MVQLDLTRPRHERHLDPFSRLRTAHDGRDQQTDRQTHRQTDVASINLLIAKGPNGQLHRSRVYDMQ